MEIVDRRSRRGKKFPKVPIKTYKWEEVRRSRRQGGYPWTHLYKEPFYEHLDAEPWTMEGMRKAKSSSTMGKSEDFSISEVSTFDNRSSIEEILDTPSLDIKDKNHSIKTSCSSLNLEEQEIEDIERTYEVVDKPEEENESPGMFFLHSEESSDDISQYLDKEERVPTETPKESEDRLKVEEELSNRKRKLSAESSTSKLSLGKKAILQKLKDTKEKIKVPKITFPTKLKKSIPKKLKNSPPEVKKSVQKPTTHSSKDVKPVYIHIPLKPPPGESDEFSHLENESTEKQEPIRKPASFRDLVKNIKHLQEPVIEHKHPSPIREVQEEEQDDPNSKQLFEDNVQSLSVSDQPIIEEAVTPDISESENNHKILEGAMEIVELDEESKKVSDNEDKMEAETPESVQDNELFDKLFESSTSRPRTNSKNQDRKLRSKSAEPERKRKLSLESSYSRKSLSKLGILKKLRDAKDKIKNTLSRATSKKDIKVNEEPIKPVVKPKTELKAQKKVQPVYIHIPLKPPEGQTDEFSHYEFEPRPIEKGEPETEKVSTTPETPDSPLPAANGDVQLIILTAPSDDEILDYNSSDVAETPISEKKAFFPLKVHELKEIAKVAVDEISGSSTSTKLAPVSEEPVSPKSSLEDISSKLLEEEKQKENIMVDEEDGLSETKKQETLSDEIKMAIKAVTETVEKMEEKEVETKKEEVLKKSEDETQALVTDTKSENLPEESTNKSTKTISEEEQTSEEKVELKSVLKSPNSPVMKKKVSFKRKSKNKIESHDDQEESKSEAVTVDEDETGLKEDNIKDTSDQNGDDKWSKISDHDEEPMPPTNHIEIPTFTLNSTPSVVISTEQAMGLPEQENYGFSTKHVYEEISEDPQKKSPKTQRVAFSTTTDSRSSDASEKPKESPSKFQAAFKQKADNFKHKIQNMKRPHINFPDRPKFQKPNLQRFKIEKPKWNMPKIPDTARINLPNFSLPRRQGGKKTVKRIPSTESTSGGSKKALFDFGTYPRIFKKKSKPEISSDFATVPRAKKTDSSKSTEDSKDSRKSASDSIRIPLHTDDSMEKEEFSLPTDHSDLGQSSHIRYGEGIDSEDEYDKETRELMDERDFLSRWQRGRFNPDELVEKHKGPRVTDLDSPSEDREFSPNNENNQRYSSGSSVSVHRQGVIEEINPDEFFLRQKGISQDNIEVGMYLSTEIREAFRNPTNALVQMEDNNFDKGSHHSLPEIQSKKKPIRKPKRKKTPHASHERIPYGEDETADEDLDIPPPSRPKRRSKRKKKTNEFIPYQETIQADGSKDRFLQHRESLDILADDEQDFMYENERMEGIEQPDIKISNPYKDYGEEEDEEEEEEEEEKRDEEKYEEREEEISEYVPEPPPRMKPKINNSLKTFEAGSAVQSFDIVSRVPSNGKVPERISYHTKENKMELEPETISYELNITEPEFAELDHAHFETKKNNFNNYRYMDESTEEFPPAAPPRKQKSMKSLTISENESLPDDFITNRATFTSEKDLTEPQIDAIRTESKIIIPIEPPIPLETEIPPVRPTRSRASSKSRTGSRIGSRAASESRVISQSEPISQQDDSLSVQADSMKAEPIPCVEEPCIQTVCDYMGYTTVDRNKPRDPPLPPPRTLQRKKRSKRDQENKFFTVPRSKAQEEDAPVRPSRIYSTIAAGQTSVNPDLENKENLEIDILQYIEPDDSRNLQSGEVIEKIRVRPLPTPPRPPRKSRPLSDITSRENIIPDSTQDLKAASAGETEVYTQTEPLPDDFVCEEVIQEPTDRVIIPTQNSEHHRFKRELNPNDFEGEEAIQQNTDSMEKPKVKRELITPTVFTHEETITHGSLLVEPLNGARILPDSDFTEVPKEKIIPVHVESDLEETSYVPEDFHKLSDPKGKLPESHLKSKEMDVLKAHKLKVTDLDVDTLTVNKLLAEKIVVSEIDSSSIKTNEISSKTGALKIGDISLPPEVLDQILRSIQSSQVSDEAGQPTDDLGEQKKTPIPPRSDVGSYIQEESNAENVVSPKEYLAEPETSEEERLSDVSVPETALVEDNEDLRNELLPLVAEDLPLLLEIEESPPEVPHRIVNDRGESPCDEQFSQDHEPPHRPPRQSERLKPSQSTTEVSMQEPEVDDEPPPRPPQPPLGYIPSQPPSSFYALRAQKYVDENIPVVPRRRRHTKSKQPTRSSSEESLESTPVVRRLHRRSSEPSIGQLSGQLVRACGSEANNALKRLITYILNNVFHNEDGKQDLNVMIIIVLVLIAGLLLLGYGEERTVVHLHHWEYFNPPKNL